MKLSYRQIEPFVKNPDPAARVILVYGPDDGLMRERAKAMGMSVVSDYNDPFNVVVLSAETLGEDPARLSDEANAMSMMGGGRLIRVENAGDKVTSLVKDYLADPSAENLIILEAGELGPSSSLRKLCEKEKAAAAVPCYVEDERDLSRLIRDIVQENNLSIEPDAVAWLAANISGNRQKARSEIDKLIVYKGSESGQITLDDSRAVCGEAGALSLDDLVYGTGLGQSTKALKMYDQLMEEGVNFIVIVRALQNHFRRLHYTKSYMENGASLPEAMKKLRPPVFFKYERAFQSQAQRWSVTALESVLEKLMDLEAQCKQTGAPVETLCAQAILGISAVK